MSLNPLPFSVLKFLHRNLTNLTSTNENKHDIIDANRVPYSVRFNPAIPNFFSVADENGFIKFFTTHPTLKIVKEFNAQKSCIYDMQWLDSNELACGGGDKYACVYDVNSSTRLATLKAHTESVKSITHLSNNKYILASGSRDGSIFVFDLRCNRQPSTDDPNVSYIRSVNSINPAHFMENPTYHVNSPKSRRQSNVLRSRILNSTQNSHLHSPTSSASSPSTASHKKASPIGCILFQNDHTLISAGGTDGIIKVWDTRKITIPHHNKKTCLNEHMPVQTYEILSGDQAHISKNTKGFSNLLLNSSRTKLYSNCMNNYIYEHDCITYNNRYNRQLTRNHINQSNFIKSAISKCDNFILTGSSDNNAYIYSTNVNANNPLFKKHMPVIVLKGHTNEVTAVDWNPIDSNQLVTCSDDNTIRVWNVQLEIDTLSTGEINFSRAELVQDQNQDLSEESYLDSYDYSLYVNFNNRLINKYVPNSVGIYDDYIFTGFDFNRFNKRVNTKLRDKMIEKELCMKYEAISMDFNDFNYDISHLPSSNETSPTSKLLNSIKSELESVNGIFNTSSGHKNTNKVNLLRPLANLPINIIETETQMNTEPEAKIETSPNYDNVFKLLRDNTSTISEKLSKNSASKRLRTPLKSVQTTSQNKVKNSIQSSLEACVNKTPKQELLKNISSSTSKKRSINYLNKIKEESSNIESSGTNLEPRTPQTKRRLVMPADDSTTAQTTATQSPARTLLHYFQVKTNK